MFLNTSPGAGGSTLGKGIPLSCLAFMQDNFSHSGRRQGSEWVQFILLFFHQVCQLGQVEENGRPKHF